MTVPECTTASHRRPRQCRDDVTGPLHCIALRSAGLSLWCSVCLPVLHALLSLLVAAAHTAVPSVLQVVTVAEYDEYCHYVAGLVGIGLSNLFGGWHNLPGMCSRLCDVHQGSTWRADSGNIGMRASCVPGSRHVHVVCKPLRNLSCT
jgi:hypothetical protein